MIVGIRFRPNGQLYFFSADMPLSEGNAVIVETEQGIGFGHVDILRDTLPADMQNMTLSPVLRMASAEDCQMAQDNTQLTKEAFTYCKQCIAQRELDMKLVDVEIFFDRSKFIFYFTAPLRIDFRELVKDLVREYRTRIELRQIGVRHETQMVGAVGSCGMVCCCRRYLRKFAPVTIRMAKEQSLFLNPVKISGICGRLLCCLSFEQENYDNFHNQCPKLGKKYQTLQGPMKVLRSNMFRNAVIALNENNEEVEISLEDWHAINPKRPDAAQGGQQSGQQSGQQKSGKKNPPQGDGLLVVTMDNLEDDAFAYTEDPYAPAIKKPLDLQNMDAPSKAKEMQESADKTEQHRSTKKHEPHEKGKAAKRKSPKHAPKNSQEAQEAIDGTSEQQENESIADGGGIFGLAPKKR